MLKLDLPTLFEKAQNSGFHRWLLSQGLSRFVPFNKVHGFKVTQVTADGLTVLLPYKRSNFNHLKGLHACALATLAELTTGVSLLAKVDPKKYRLILKTLKMEYYLQGKMGATATFTVEKDWLQQHLFVPLQNQDSILVTPEIKIYDLEGNHLCTGFVEWQIKNWDKVKMKV